MSTEADGEESHEPTKSDGATERDKRQESSLSSGFPGFDDAFLSGGLLPGTLVGVFSDEFSIGERFAENMSANRPTYYISFLRSKERITQRAEEKDNFDTNRGQFYSIEPANDGDHIDDMLNVLEELDLPSNSTFIITGFNAIEETDKQVVQEVIEKIKKTVEETDSIGVIHTVDNGDQNNWLLKTLCDTALKIQHTEKGGDIKNQLRLERYRGEQTLINEQYIFQLSEDINTKISVGQSITT